MTAIILAIDTSAGTSVALVSQGQVLSSRSTPDTMRHAEVVGPFIEEVLTEAGVKAESVTHVAAGMGPGPFTGLRVGIAAADAFAFGAGAILLPMVSHDAVAAEHFATSHEPVLVVTDARRKELFWSKYSKNADGIPTRVEGPALAKADEVPLAEGLRLDAREVHAHWLGLIAEAMFLQGKEFPPATAVYLRSPDVTMSNGPKRVVQEMRGGKK
ncbi:tRNA (adenosine(37)-N6)-threonylcarbamoyltransferase complex dimerization subunit type 1 TsaB [Aurantimicrobium sp. MWH-Uga1]|uniref:tRNA (adenosine(37)-N6)-threonylcarbamoyltransferase complex dimerization subunit type 1 TsaB n=1 Tax=Aurantimicrobium sp. MWH-Uga1 TaxID=2079575 RepID=UPI000DF03369|nr:tRNA threonylcarbamoyladenosine biosynthesis protein TsaB [Aurantimicrobium sp. MWH-Uga1]